MTLFRRSAPMAALEAVPVVTPRATIDGWTLDGTPLARSTMGAGQRELCTLLHGVGVGVDTPYTYDRAVQMLEAAGELAQAHAVCVAWLGRPAARRPENVHVTRTLTRHRDRLHARLAARSASAPAP